MDTGAKAQGLVVKMYVSNSGKRKTQHDLVRLRVAYSLGPAGCVDPGVHTYQSSGDAWIQQDGAGAWSYSPAPMGLQAKRR